MIYVLAHDTARNRAIESIKSAPDGYIVTIKEPTRNSAQNALIHAELQEVGDILGWKFSGQDVDLDDIKTIFMAAYRAATKQETRFVMGINNQPVILSWRTRDLTKREASEFVEFVRAWVVDNVVDRSPDHWRGKRACITGK